MPSRRTSRDERGQAAAELALALPLVVVAFCVIVQLALVIIDQVVLVHAAREAARQGAISDHPDTAALDAARRSTGDPHVGVTTIQVDGRVEVRLIELVQPTVPIAGWFFQGLALRATASMLREP
jgi:Flp pilus assembly protein TadG